MNNLNELDPILKNRPPYSAKGVIRKPERYLPNGRYDPRALNPNYYKNYYHERLRFKQECGWCGAAVVGGNSNMRKHQDTNTCMTYIKDGVSQQDALNLTAEETDEK
jgi:hypothetical protein